MEFSIGASLQICAWLEVMKWHALRNDLQRSGKRGISKIRGKRDSSRYWNGLMVFWAFPKQNFYFEQKKIDRKLANGHAEQLFGKSAA
jgi:hypothetical protein